VVAAVTLVGLDPLARLEEITQNLLENFNVGIYPQDKDTECRPPSSRLPFGGCVSQSHRLSSYSC
jgi:hypothetical protein